MAAVVRDQVDGGPGRPRTRRRGRRQWCKGRPGVEHEPEVWIRPELNGSCQWAARWSLETRCRRVEWQCEHVMRCPECEKVLEDTIPVGECPRYPGSTEQLAAAEKQLARQEAAAARAADSAPWARLARRRDAQRRQMGVSGYRRNRDNIP